jgi:hypothetical protein
VSSNEWDPTRYATALLDRDYVIRTDAGDDFGSSGRPRHLDPVNDRRITKPEVQPQIVLGQVARARPHVADLRSAASRDAHARTDGIAIPCPELRRRA